MKKRWLVFLCAGFAALVSAKADLVTDWNESCLDSIRATSMPPPKASRFLAMLHTSIFDAVNGAVGGYRPYLVAGPAPAGVSVDAAVSAAALEVLKGAFPARVAVLQADYDARVAVIADGPAKTAGVAWGTTVAQQIVASRAADGSTAVVTYVPGTGPGQWRPTFPAFAPALLPQWGDVTPFGIQDTDKYVPDGKSIPALTSKAYASDYALLLELGRKVSTVRTADQTIVAKFWANGGGTATPPGHWNQIARTISGNAGLTLAQNARLFAQLNVAMADAGIVAWATKYAANFWRPIAAIREGATDGNAKTNPDPTWESFLVTPPFPAYTSGHSTFSAAAAEVIGRFFGTGKISFIATSDDAPGIQRAFTKVSDAAAESGLSRIYGGIHWTWDNEDGLSSGKKIGSYVARKLLRPIHGGPNDDLNDE